jgi:hypothetical protein
MFNDRAFLKKKKKNLLEAGAGPIGTNPFGASEQSLFLLFIVAIMAFKLQNLSLTLVHTSLSAEGNTESVFSSRINLGQT